MIGSAGSRRRPVTPTNDRTLNVLNPHTHLILRRLSGSLPLLNKDDVLYGACIPHITVTGQLELDQVANPAILDGQNEHDSAFTADQLPLGTQPEPSLRCTLPRITCMHSDVIGGIIPLGLDSDLTDHRYKDETNNEKELQGHRDPTDMSY